MVIDPPHGASRACIVPIARSSWLSILGPFSLQFLSLSFRCFFLVLGEALNFLLQLGVEPFSESNEAFVAIIARSDEGVNLLLYPLGKIVLVRKDRCNSVQNDQCTPCLHKHLFSVFEAKVHSVSDAFVDAPHDLFDKLLVRDAHRWIDKLPRKAAVSFALSLPHALIAPMMQLFEKFKEEYSQILSLFLRAEVDCRHDALQNLTEEGQEVEVGNAKLVQELAKLEGEQGIFR